MQSLLKVSTTIDRVLAFIARIGAWCGFTLVLVVLYDVISRYFGVPKPFGLNSTQIQESEYWLHTFLFTFVIGYAYTRQAHVRIDLLREMFRPKTKYAIEIIGIVIFLMTFASLGTWYTAKYTYASFLENEVSRSTIGFSNIWLLKSALPLMFIMMGLAGISQLIKSVAGFAGKLPRDKAAQALGEDA
jgi:TRAP-type mannitol/chloroaromatic compound transport system permease small subunit